MRHVRFFGILLSLLAFAAVPATAASSPDLTTVEQQLSALVSGSSADVGIDALPFSSALAVRAARYIYSEIGERLRERGADPFLGRAYVGAARKLWLVTKAVLVTTAHALRVRGPARVPSKVLGFGEAVSLEKVA